jgi:hypothetical protein
MPEPLLFLRTLSGLSPADERSQEALRKVKHGSVITADIKRPRNGKALRLYWALVGKVFSNLHENLTYRTPEELSDAIKICLGEFDIVTLPSGSTFARPHSISFAKMTEDSFRTYLDGVIKLVIEKFLPGVTDGELRMELEQMVGLRHAG